MMNMTATMIFILSITCLQVFGQNIHEELFRTRDHYSRYKEISKTNSGYKSAKWQVMSTKWSQIDEEIFQDFISILGEARREKRCGSTHTCLTSKIANPYFSHLNPPSIKNFYSDCADLGYILRGYFAWMMDLPFAYPNRVAAKGPTKDIRYTAKGNTIKGHATVTSGSSVTQTLRNIANSVSTAYMRIHPEDDSSDLYSLEISREAIKSGTVVYSPDGHVYVFYKITEEGDVYMIDAHPDNSISHAKYSSKVLRSHPNVGHGFKGWKKSELVGATKSDGLYYGGEVHYAKSSSHSDYSLVQYHGTDPASSPAVDDEWKKGRFSYNGEQYDYYQWIKRVLSSVKIEIDVLKDFETKLNDLCLSFEERVGTVNQAIESNLHKQSHPSKLPDNIYGAFGDWETYSSPGSDSRRKNTIKTIMSDVKFYQKMILDGNPEYIYNGSDLQLDLLSLYNDFSENTCRIKVIGTTGKSHILTLNELIQNSYKLSFDPYHCVELRWGLTDGNSLASCKQAGEFQEKYQWYQGEQGLRNMLEKDTNLFTGYDLSSLLKTTLGSKSQETLSIREAIESL